MTTKRINKAKEVKATNVANEITKKVDSYVIDKLKKINYEKSNKFIKDLSNVSFKVVSIRIALLAYAAKDNKILQQYNNDDRIQLLRKSKKDSELYRNICDIAAFTYKRIVTKVKDSEDQISYHKSYTNKSVMHACDILLQTPSFELTKEYVQDIRFEREKQAINKLKTQISNLQKQTALLAETIEECSENSELSKEYAEQLAKTEKTLQNKTVMFEYVSVASNRKHIK